MFERIAKGKQRKKPYPIRHTLGSKCICETSTSEGGASSVAMVALELTSKMRTKLPREEEAVTKGVGGHRDDTEARASISSLSLSLSLSL